MKGDDTHMRTWQKHGILVVCAALLLAFYLVPLTCLQHVCTPRYVQKADPEYQYLFAALSMARLDRVYYSDHPGSTVQMLGALSLRAAHLFSDQPLFLHDVLSHPERYLDVFNAGLILFGLLMLLLAAWLTWHITEELRSGVIVLLTPLFCFYHFTFALSQVRSESVLFSAALLLGLCVLATDSPLRRSHPQVLAVLSALVVGFGAATKLAFAPLGLFPLLVLPRVRARVLYLCAAPLAFLLWLGPALPTYDLAHRILPWLKRSGTQGLGDSIWLGSRASAVWTEMVVTERPFFMLFACAALVCCFAGIYQLARRQRPARSTGVLAALLITVAIQLFAAVRAGMANYMFSSAALAGIILVLTLKHFRLFLPQRTAQLAHCLVLVLFTAWCCARGIPKVRERCMLKMRSQSQLLSLERKLETEYNDYTRVHHYYHGFKPFALYFGNGFAKHQYAAALDTLYPNTYFWAWDGIAPSFLRGFQRKLISFDQLWFDNDRIVMIGSPLLTDSQRRPRVPLREVMRASDATLTIVDRERVWSNELQACAHRVTRSGWPTLNKRAADARLYLRFADMPRNASTVPAVQPQGQFLQVVATPADLQNAWDVCGFRAIHRRLEWPNAPVATGTGDCTVACLIRIGDKPGWHVPLGHGDGTSDSSSPWFFLCVNDTCEIQFVTQFVLPDGTPREVRIGHRLPPDSYFGWHTLIGTYLQHDRKLALFVDGTLAATADVPVGARRNTSNAPLTIGSLANGNLPFLGYIREVIAFDRTLPADELASMTK